MKYALISDLHSSIKDTKAVLHQIKEHNKEAAIYCLGDLYECKIGKKKATTVSNVPLKEAAVMKKKFEKLLTFPSIRGNQEERITLVTGIEKFASLPETMTIEGATLIHGHQFQWAKDWQPTFIDLKTPIVFFGHSHKCGLYQNDKKLPMKIHFGEEISLDNGNYFVNVGSVVKNREWCLYDSSKRTIRFMKAT